MKKMQGHIGDLEPVRFLTVDETEMHHVTFQGELLTWKVINSIQMPASTKKRGIVKNFSRSSRLRILKFIKTVDWNASSPCLFITTTLPDNHWPVSRYELNTWRAKFWRYLEKRLGCHIAAIWRIEWKCRLEGLVVGQIMPHFHFVVFNTQYIDCNEVNEYWRKTIGYDGKPRTETKGMKNQGQSAAYVADYCSKEESFSLVFAAYHNKPSGRDWGFMRKSLIPLHEKTEVVIESERLIEQLREIATEELPGANITGKESFTVLGPLARTVYELLHDIDFDEVEDR